MSEILLPSRELIVPWRRRRWRRRRRTFADICRAIAGGVSTCNGKINTGNGKIATNNGQSGGCGCGCNLPTQWAAFLVGVYSLNQCMGGAYVYALGDDPVVSGAPGTSPRATLWALGAGAYSPTEYKDCPPVGTCVGGTHVTSYAPFWAISTLGGTGTTSWAASSNNGNVNVYENAAIPLYDPASNGVFIPLAGKYPNSAAGYGGYLVVTNFPWPSLPISSLPTQITLSGGTYTQTTGTIYPSASCGGYQLSYNEVGAVAASGGYADGNYTLSVAACPGDSGSAHYASYVNASGQNVVTWSPLPMAAGDTPGFWQIGTGGQTYRSKTLLGTYTQPANPFRLPASRTVTA